MLKVWIIFPGFFYYCTRVRNMYCSIMWTYLGQNFLINSKIRSYIADKVSVLYKNWWCEALIEIGPGKWSITKLIQHISSNFFMIDKDPIFFDTWKLVIENWIFISADVLDVDVEKLLKDKKIAPNKTCIVWNLPYYITSPILRKFFEYGTQAFAGGVFMVQDEVGQKIKYDATKKSYLWRLLNYAYEVTYLKWVPAKCFKPAPKVKSCLIEFRIKNAECRIDRNKFIEFLDMFAPFSRKTLGAIHTMIKKKSDIYFIIPESLQKKRLEECTWDDIRQIL